MVTMDRYAGPPTLIVVTMDRHGGPPTPIVVTMDRCGGPPTPIDGYNGQAWRSPTPIVVTMDRYGGLACPTSLIVDKHMEVSLPPPMKPCLQWTSMEDASAPHKSHIYKGQAWLVGRRKDKKYEKFSHRDFINGEPCKREMSLTDWLALSESICP